MGKDKSNLTIEQRLLNYHTRLQGVSTDLAIKLLAVMSLTDADVKDLLISELPKQKDTLKAELKRLPKIIEKIAAIRKKSYDAGKDLIFDTVAKVVTKCTDVTAQAVNAEIEKARRNARERRFCKTLTPEQQQAIIQGQGVDGATIAKWFEKFQLADLERIASFCQRASVEAMSVADITRAVRGTKAKNYTDGLLATTQSSAVMLARTLINGVSNNTRAETIKANSDVIDGIKFLATLDGKTCKLCAPYDGYVWRGDDMSQARRPPIHPNCRCTLIPYVELKDQDGNPIELEGERPAARDDFEDIARKTYNAQAKAKNSQKRWDDLSPSTRLKYYYKAMKDYEARTGKSAYAQVDGSTTFAEYFKTQPESFKRSWLGATRYASYKSGALSEESIFKPQLGYRVLINDFVKSTEDEDELQALVEQAQTEPGATGTDQDEPEPDEERLVADDPTYEPVVPAFRGVALAEIDAYDEFTKFEEDDFDKFFAELETSRKADEKEVESRKPGRVSYHDSDRYNDAVKAWEQNARDVAVYYEHFKEVAESTRKSMLEEDERHAYRHIEPEYITPDGQTISEGNLDDFVDIYLNLSTDDQRKSVHVSIDRAWVKWQNDVEANSPQRDNFHFERNYNRSSESHRTNGARGKGFFETLIRKLQEAIKKFSSTAPYQPVQFEWQTKYGLWGDAKTTEAIAKLDADALEELLQDLDERYKQLLIALDANLPDDAPASHKNEWQKNQRQLADSYDAARRIIDKALNERRLADAQKLYNVPPTDAADVITRIEQLRVNELGQQEADRLNEEAAHLAEDINNIPILASKVKKLREESEALKWKIFLARSDADKDKLEEEKERIDAELADLKTKYSEALRKERDHASGWDKAERLKQLAVLFPDRGGATFFSNDFRMEAQKKFKKHGLEEVAREVFEIYDIIARAYNTGLKKLDPPTGVKFVRSKKFAGRFNDGIIEISANYLTPHDVRETFAHELGHWLEAWALGGARCTKNAEWLFSEQEYTPTGREHKIRDFRIPNEKQPNLCAETDNYSQRYYGVGYVNSTEVGAATELISTAIEHLMRDPELFARRCPKHLALLLENLSELSK